MIKKILIAITVIIIIGLFGMIDNTYTRGVRVVEVQDQKVIVVDVGSWTIDIMPIENKKPINEKCISKPIGLITCMRDVNSECYRKLGEEVDESIIQSVMRGENPSISDEYVEVIRNQIHNYVESVYHSLREYGVNLKTTKIVFVGGGASVMKNFGAIDNKNISYILDIKSNAKGFEQMGIMAIKKKNGRWFRW